MPKGITSSPPARPDGATTPTGNSPVRRKGSLLDLKTDLKSLKYSQFGVSPPIVKDINDPPKYNAEPLQVGRRVDDLVRITKFVASANGLKFVAKQGLLSQINQDRTGTRKEKLKAAIKDGAVNAAKVLGSTLAQVPLSGTGVHFIRGFGGYSYLTPGTPPPANAGFLGKLQEFTQNKLGLGGGLNGSEIVLAGNNIILDYLVGDDSTPEDKSELLDKAIELSTRKDDDPKVIIPFKKFNPTFAEDDRLKESTYIGNGTPFKSSIKEGNTELPDQTIEDGSNAFGNRRDGGPFLEAKVTKNPTGNSKLVDSVLAPKTNRLPGKATDRSKEKGTPELTNFLSAPNTQTDPNRRPEVKDYKSREDNLRLRTGMGEQGRKKNKNDIQDERGDIYDAINRALVESGRREDLVDIIPFEIEVISPDARTDKRYSTNNFIYFRAHLGSFSDDFTGNWNETNYVGRAEPMYSYNGFNRSVSFDFKIAAFSRSELLPLYQKLNFLASSTAPTYSSDVGFMRGTFSRLTVGDYLYDVPGFFSKIGISWEVGYPWEINLENDAKLPKVPHILNVNCGFTPVHDFVPAVNQPFLMNSTFYPYTPSDSIIG